MSYVKRILCLANSRKLSGRCIAGKELSSDNPSGWIRPVSAREHEEVSECERQYVDGSDPCVLDIIDVPLLEPRPRSYQQENWLLNPNRSWTKVGRAVWGDLHRLADPAGPLWINGISTFSGLNDQIPLSQASNLNSSLRLIQVDRLILSVCTFGDSRRRVQGRFGHNGTQYRLWITDPIFERTYLEKPDGDYEIGETFLTISLSEPYNGACYKLIAAIIPRDEVISSKYPVFSIGHSNHSIDTFVSLLRRHNITAIADVRSTPYSRFNPQFNRDVLERSLAKEGIKYVFLGRELGARSEDRTCYENGRVKYDRLALTDLFRSGIERVIRGANSYRIALMCAEKDPLACHRTLLVARKLAESGIVVQHILADGSLETHDVAMERLLDVVGLPRQDLFRSRSELIAEALLRQEERVAYVDDKLAAEDAQETP